MNPVAFEKNSSEFTNTLRQRVDDYFTSRGLSKNADFSMYLKTFILLGFYFVPYFFIVQGHLSYLELVLSYFIMGLSGAGIGMSVMHDANHEAYFSNKKLNKIFGHTLELLGASSYNWRMQHNVLHHTYTNIDGLDEDLQAGKVLRFSRNSPLKKYHGFQHIYGPFLYSLLAVGWIGWNDYFRLKRYIDKGFFKGQSPYFTYVQFAKLIISKVLYFIYILIIPIYLSGLSGWQVFSGFVVMNLICGLILSVIFQLAHINNDASFNMPEGATKLEHDWTVHQLLTTANFAPKNWFLNWYVGGLNFQVEHHLFPNCCHIHYPNIAPIVEKTANEYGIPYHSFTTFSEAFKAHIQHLKELGNS